MNSTPIAPAPEWLSRAAAHLECAGCDAPDPELVAVYIPPRGSRRYGYRLCARCASTDEGRRRVAMLVEARVRRAEAIELCTMTGGAA
jgi:hypothetical protein